MARRYNTRFRPAKGFETIVLNEVSGVGARVRGRRGRDETKLNEIGEYIVNRARDIASETPALPRGQGGLRRARLVGTGQLVPREGYDFRREREGQKPYLTSFFPPIVRIVNGRVEVTVTNFSPAAQMVEEGTGAEGEPIQARSRLFRLPITQRAYRRMSRMSLAERRRRGLLSGDPAYRRAAARHYRIVNSDRINPDSKKFKQVEHGGFGSKQSLRNARKRRAARMADTGTRTPRQIIRQMRGYERRFIEVDRRSGRIGRTEGFKVKRERYLINKNGRAYLGTERASKYAGYGIFLRAMNDAVRRFF